jgi:hypothetical protein
MPIAAAAGVLEASLERLRIERQEIAASNIEPETRDRMLEALLRAEQSLRSCEDRGGRLQSRENLAWCVMLNPDAGKSCMDSSECEGQCVIVTQHAVQPGPTTEGQCSVDTPISASCYAVVSDGMVGMTLCE